MKNTLRELLLEQHRAADAELESICNQLLPGGNSELEREAVSEPLAPLPISRFFLRVWTELFWCCRYIWGGLAVIWVLVAVFQLASVESTAPGKSQGASASSVSFLVAQKRLQLELREPPPTQSPSGGPQTSRQKPAPNLRMTDITYEHNHTAFRWTSSAFLNPALSLAV